MKFFSKKVLLLIALPLVCAGIGIATRVNAQKSGPRLYNDNIGKISVNLGQYDRTSAEAFRNGTATDLSRAQAISTYLSDRAGIDIPAEVLKGEVKTEVSTINSSQLADIVVDQSLAKIQKSDDQSFKAFLKQVVDNKGMFVRLDTDGRAEIISQNDIIFGLLFARKKGDRETLKALAKPLVQEAIETTAAYFAKASPEFSRNTSDGTVFTTPEALLVTYTIFSNDFGVFTPTRAGERVVGPFGTLNQFPVQFFVNQEMATRLANGR